MGREMQRLKTWEAHCHLGQSPPHQKSLFFVAWNHCIISGKTEKDREPQVCPALAFGGRDEGDRGASLPTCNVELFIAVPPLLVSLALISEFENTVDCKSL